MIHHFRTLSCALIVFVTLLLSACGGSPYVSYVPPPYPAGQCYYVNSPLEVQYQVQSGLCQASWLPTLMPLAYHARYSAYYDSPAYYNVYVPVESRTTYVTTVRTFETTNKATIDTEAKNATWKGTDGKTYDGAKVQQQQQSGKASFGGGDVRSSGFSGGDVRDSKGKPASNSATSVAPPATTRAPAAAPATSAPAKPPAAAPVATSAPAKPAVPPSNPATNKPSGSTGSTGFGGGSARSAPPSITTVKK